MKSGKYFLMMLFCSTLVVSSCGPSDETGSEPEPVSSVDMKDGTIPESYPSSDSSDADLYQTIDPETALINSSNGRVVRTSPDTLQINLENGEKVILKDFHADTDRDDQVKYIYKGFDERSRQYLIAREMWEDYNISAINAQDGTEQTLPELPIYNPSKNIFICAWEGNELLGTVIDIFNLEGYNIKNVFHEEPDWFIENMTWENDSTITLNAWRYSWNYSEQAEIIRGKAKIQFKDGSWQVTPPAFQKEE